MEATNVDYARAILKADKEDSHHSTDDICDLARKLSKNILKQHLNK